MKNGLTRRGALLAGAALAALPATGFAAPTAGGAPRLVRVSAVAPNILELRVQEGAVARSRQLPYIARAGDVLKEERDQLGILTTIKLERDGQFVGWITGLKREMITYPDTYLGRDLDAEAARRPQSYALIDSAGRSIAPRKVHHKAKANQFARREGRLGFSHAICLEFDAPLKDGETYKLSLEGAGLDQAAIDYKHAPAATRSEAVHVNQVGFAPNDPIKWAFLSYWLGKDASVRYGDRVKFQLIDEASGRAVFSGTAKPHWPASKADYLRREGNLTKADVYRLDFSGFNRPGAYRVHVEGVGCSYPFEIAAGAWERVISTSLRGLYHQRSGIALGPPYTTFIRPRPHHPDDGFVARQSTATLMNTSMGMGLGEDSFEALVRTQTDKKVAAWGGYQDAGDWDRRSQHLMIPRTLLELYELAPDYFSKLKLNIPENQNDLPDYVDEAIWTLDFFKQLQQPDGGVSGGIEASAHPAPGDTSWTEILPLFAYAPDPWSTYKYASAAARAAFVLKPLRPALAAEYLASAERAMAWAEKEFAGLGEAVHPQLRGELVEERNLAAVELYRATGSAPYHETFKAQSVLATGADAPRAQRNAMFVYATLPANQGEAALKARAKALIVADADACLAFAARNAYDIAAPNHEVFAAQGFFSGPVHAAPLVRAHVLTRQAKYLRAAYAASQFGLGANPDNLSFTTGLGSNWPVWALKEDAIKTGQDVPEGITVYGPFDYDTPETNNRDSGWFYTGNNWPDTKEKMNPQFVEWPVAETYVDMWNWLCMNEFTPQETMAPSAYVWGYLAAQRPR